MSHSKQILIGLAAVTLILTAVYISTDDAPDHPAAPPAAAAKTMPVPRPAARAQATRPQPEKELRSVATAPGAPFETPTAEEKSYTSVRLAEAEEALTRNEIYEDTAWTTLPLLSLQTHNPVWALEQEGTAGRTGPLPAPEAGAFGKMQPPQGEIWLRIPPEYAGEHRDIMAQNADLYRAETGYDGPVTVTLWVGGRPYRKIAYE